MKSKQGIKTGIILGLALLLFGSCKEEEMYTIQEFTKLACTFHDKSIPNGQSVTAYSAESLVYNAKCSSVAETRTCEDGELSGTFEFNSCVEEPPATCTFDNQTVLHDGYVEAFSKSSVEWNEACGSVKAIRTCDNGTLSNSDYIFPTCVTKEPLNCTFNSQIVLHDETIEAFSTNLTDYPTTCSQISKNLKCTNGEFDSDVSTYAYSSCSDGSPSSCTLDNKTVGHNQSDSFALASTVAFGESCTYLSRTCLDGTLNGDSNYKFASCTETDPVDCDFSDGGTLAHNSVQPVAYNAAVSDWPNECSKPGVHASYNIFCTNGSFSTPDFTYEFCVDGGPDNCTLTDNNTPSNQVVVSHGDNATAYSQKTVGYDQSCADFSATVACWDKTLSPSGYSYSACAPGPPASCQFNGTTKAHGITFPAYSTNQVAWNGSCSDNESTLSCNNGVITGPDNQTHIYASCGKATPRSCTFNGQTVSHGSTTKAYRDSSSGNGGDCSATEERLCTDSALDGTYQYSNCLHENILVGARYNASGSGVTGLEFTTIPLDIDGNYYQERDNSTGSLVKLNNSDLSGTIIVNGVSQVISFNSSTSDTTGSQALAVSVVIDSSGSMKTNDPNKYRYQAVDSLIDLLPVNTRLQVGDFITWPVDPPTPYVDSVISDVNRNVIKNDISEIALGGTPLYDSMYVAQDELKKIKKTRNIIISLSDGKDTSENFDSNFVIGRINTFSAEVYNIGLVGDDVEDQIDLAFKAMPNKSKSGGSYQEVTKANAADLSVLFSNLGKTTSTGYAKNSGTLPNGVDLIEGTTYTGTITIREITHTFTFTR